MKQPPDIEVSCSELKGQPGTGTVIPTMASRVIVPTYGSTQDNLLAKPMALCMALNDASLQYSWVLINKQGITGDPTKHPYTYYT